MWNLIKGESIKNSFDGIPESHTYTTDHMQKNEKIKDSKMIYHHAAHNS